MAKPYRESLAQSERDRTKAREMVIGKRRPDYGLVDEYHFTPPSVSTLTISDIRSAIRSSAEFAEMHGMLGGGGAGAGMGIGPAVHGGTYLLPDDYVHMQKQAEAAALAAEDQYIVTSPRELNGLKAALEAAHKSIAERDEIIEALVADLEDIDALREENDRLRSAEAMKVKLEVPSPLTIPSDAWYMWDGDDHGHQPPDAIVAVQFRGGQKTVTGVEAKTYRWNHTGRGARDADIIAYKVIG